jgi:hypothetical protein
MKQLQAKAECYAAVVSCSEYVVGMMLEGS